MSGWLIGLVGFIYAGIAIDSLRQGNIGTAITFAGYSFSNVGLYILAKAPA